MAVGRALAAEGRGRPNRDALTKSRKQAIALQDTAFLPALDAALARPETR
ncbi:MAG: hypothetical protein ABI607_07335 [Betaproteobacteria bacterium]